MADTLQFPPRGPVPDGWLERERLYTLADFRELAREYADEHHNEARLAIQQMTKEWLERVEKKEKERVSG